MSGYVEYYNENEGRAYPIMEYATRVSDDGLRLDDSIIADLSLQVPDNISNIYISSLRITPYSVSVGISSVSGGLFAAAVPRASLASYKAYPLTSVLPSTSGWIVFGSGVYDAVETTHYKFSNAGQSGVELKAIRIIQTPPVSSVRKYNGYPDQTVDKIVRLVPGPNVKIHIDPEDSQRILIGLTEEAKGLFVNPCQNTATEKNCGSPPIRTINGVAADEDGKITIRFE